MSPIAVTDSLSSREEHVVELARLIGTGHKRTVFQEVYRGQKQIKSVSEISERTGLTETQILKAGVSLVAGHAIQQTSVNGRVAYGKILSHKAIKDKILKIAGNRREIEKIPTKRSPKILLDKSIFLQSTRKRASEKGVTAKRTSASATKVAFLLASPVGVSGINVSMDYREALSAVQSSENRDRIDLKPFPAAHAGTLLDVLNEYRPDIIHFSGHGGGQALVFDRAEVVSSGGMIVDYELVGQMLSATDTKPKLLVMAACDTVDGASGLLDAVPVIVAMSDSVSDWAAAFFSRRFYAALAGKQSVQHAFDQARSYLAAEKLPDADLPTLMSAPGADPSAIRFV